MAENNGFTKSLTEMTDNATKRPAKSPAVRVLLSITGNQGNPPQEVVRKATKAHEVVEVDGFVFKRKRRVPPGESDDLAPDDSAAKRARVDSMGGSEHADSDASVHPDAEPPAAQNAPGGQEGTAGGAAAAAAAMVAGPRGDGEAQAPAAPQAAPQQAAAAQAASKDVQEAAAAALGRLPQGEGVLEAARLLALCDALAQDELKRAEGSPVEALLRAMLERFGADVRASLGNGTLECAEGAGGEVEEGAREAAELAAELEAQRDSLAARLARLQKEEGEWTQLLCESTAPPAAEAEGSLETPDGAAREQPAAAAAAEASADAGKEGAMEQQELGRGDAAVAEQAAIAAQEAGAGLGVLQQARTDTHRTLTLQVEGLCALVEGVQELVAKAEHISSAEFDKLYKKSFSAVSGLNSPARLIREISKPAPSRLQAASDGHSGPYGVGGADRES